MKDKKIPLFIANGTTNESPAVGMLQQSAVLENIIAPTILTEAISRPVESISFGNLKPTVVTTEVSHLMVPIKNLELLNNAVSNKALLGTLSKEYGLQGVYCFVTTENDLENIAHTRFFNPGMAARCTSLNHLQFSTSPGTSCFDCLTWARVRGLYLLEEMYYVFCTISRP